MTAKTDSTKEGSVKTVWEVREQRLSLRFEERKREKDLDFEKMDQIMR